MRNLNKDITRFSRRKVAEKRTMMQGMDADQKKNMVVGSMFGNKNKVAISDDPKTAAAQRIQRMVRRIQAKMRAQRELQERFGDRYKPNVNFDPNGTAAL